MQQTMADPLALVGDEDDSAETKEKMEMLRRITEPEQMENYLSYGKWDLKENDIERLQKDDEMKQRVSIKSFYPNKITRNLCRQLAMQKLFFICILILEGISILNLSFSKSRSNQRNLIDHMLPSNVNMS